MQKGQIVIVGIALAFLAVSAGAAIVLPTDGAGSDGAFTPSNSMAAHLDLGQALTGDWSTTNGDNRRGVYDPEQWAVIFRFTEVNIPEGVEVTFTNNITHAPVIWLVQGDVIINGKVNLNGKGGIQSDDLQVGYLSTAFTEPGPGGFRGGRGSAAGTTNGSPGLGIGGGNRNEGASFSGGPVVYGNAGCFPLIGGSGGGGAGNASGGAGGGAILIASEGAIIIGPKGAIMAQGGECNYNRGNGAGSGGMIRLVADTVTVEGDLQAVGGGGQIPGYNGRILIEADTRSLTGSIHPEAVSTVPGAPLRLLRDDATPRLTPLTLGGKPIPADPKALMSSLADIYINELGLATLVVEAENVPPSMAVTARMMRREGEVDSSDLAETPLKMVKSDGVKSTWQGDVEVISGFSALQVHGVFPEE